MRRNYKGSSLVITIVISLVLSIICSAVILLAYFNRLQQQREDGIQRLERNLVSAINLVLADSSVHRLPQTETFDLFEEQQDSVSIRKELWGLFGIATVSAFRNGRAKQNSFFYGAPMRDTLDACLYVADHNRPIAIVGNTKLTGNAFLPKAGVKTAYIDQRGYNGTKLINGTIKNSGDSLPPLREEIVSTISGLLSINKSNIENNVPDSAFRSFSDTALQLYSHQKIFLRSCILSGHVIVKSDSAIEVEPSASLKNIILVAPEIRFKKGCMAIVQAMATDSLIVEKDCSFTYPSALVLVKSKTANVQNRMSIGTGCIIEGIIISLCKNTDQYKTSVEINTGSTVEGLIYVMGYLSLRGNTRGTVMTDFFIHRSSSATYENHIVDITINRPQLSYYFLVPSVFYSSTTQEVMQWVN